MELLAHLDEFIKMHGYGPSYREIMRALDYKSVSTVAIHIDGLVARGLIRKKDNSARSLEIIHVPSTEKTEISTITDAQGLAWLQKQIDKRAKAADTTSEAERKTLEEGLAILKPGQS